MNRALIIRVSNVVHIHARYSDRGLGFICELTYHSAFPDWWSVNLLEAALCRLSGCIWHIMFLKSALMLACPVSSMLVTPQLAHLACVVCFLAFSMKTSCFLFTSLYHLHYHSHFSHTFHNVLSEIEVQRSSSVPIIFTHSAIVCVLLGKTCVLPLVEFPCRLYTTAVQWNMHLHWLAQVNLESFHVKISKPFSS